MENLDLLVKELCKLPSETNWVEFKHNNDEPRMIGEDISALANSAGVADRSHSYMIWGVDNDTHNLVGTKVRLKQLKRGNQELESWLRHLLSKNADFSFHSVDIDGKHLEIIAISKAFGTPVTFEKIDYIRVGSYTKKINEFPVLQAQLWDKLRHEPFEDVYAKTDLKLHQVLRQLDCDTYFESLQIPIPMEEEGYAHYLEEEGIVQKQDNGLYAITNLGAILFAKKLSDFPRLGRKALRIVRYEGNNRLAILKEEIIGEGYAISLEKAVKYVNTILPSKEDINSVRRVTNSMFPIPAIREAVANAVIHQDFYMLGTGPVVEIFANRVEVTNPGTPLVDVMRIIDNPPKSRNEKLASLMRRLGMCEELGRGWDRMVISCELQRLPAPRIQVYEESTRVSLFSHFEFSNISTEDKLWATYLHACIRYVEGETLTNSSLRERFGLKDTSAGSVSRLLKEATSKEWIKPLDPTTARRYMKYLPFWA